MVEPRPIPPPAGERGRVRGHETWYSYINDNMLE
jgi:hypothetical protein